MKKGLLLLPLILSACGSTTYGPIVLGSATAATAEPTIGAPGSPAPLASSPTAAFRKAVTDAISKLEDPWALFCASRGQIERSMPAPEDLLKLDTDPRISIATEVLMNLGTPPKGWLELADAAKAVGVAAADATLADVLIRAQVKQGTAPTEVSDAWAARVLAPCATVRTEIDHVKELLDQLP